jgi:hypothetical protein
MVTFGRYSFAHHDVIIMEELSKIYLIAVAPNGITAGKIFVENGLMK